MAAHSNSFSISTRGFNDMQDLTERAGKFVSESKVENGIFCAFVPGSTAGITTIEYEDGVLRDLSDAIDRIVPKGIHYEHDARWGDGNGFSHVRAALVGPSLSVPVADGQLQLGTWQQIILIDFDNRPRQREIVFQIVGD